MTSQTHDKSVSLHCHSIRLRTLFLLGLSVLLAFMMIASPARAKTELSVIALVNGEPITNLELEERMLFLRALSDLKVEENALRRDALQGLVGDRLKTQFGKTTVPGILPQLDEAARNVMDTNFGRDGSPGTVVLSQLGIPERTVLNKVKADILWGNSLRQKFKRQFRNINKAAEQELEKLKQLKSEPQIRFSEIILLPNPNRTLEQTTSLADKIVEALGKGADFASIAQQYSEASTAGRGGLVDWVFVSRLPDPIKSPLLEAENGAVIGPLVLSGQVFILRKRDVRERGQMDPLAATVSLARAVAPTPATASEDQRKQAAQMLSERTANISSCSDLAELGEDLSPDIPSEINNLSVGNLSPQLRNVILELEIGGKTNPLPFSEGMVVFMLCNKTMPGFDLPEISALEQAELEKLMSTISGRFLLRLQRQASIIYKDKTI